MKKVPIVSSPDHLNITQCSKCVFLLSYCPLICPHVFKVRIYCSSPDRVQNAKTLFCPIACSSVFMFSRAGSIVHRPIVFKMQKLFLSYRLFVCLHVFKGRIHCSSPDRFRLVLNSFYVLEAYKGRLLRPTHLSYCLNSHTSNLLLSNHGQLTHLHCSFKQRT